MRIARLLLDTLGALALIVMFSAVVFFFSAADWLQYQDEPSTADFILPLAGDSARISKAAELFSEGLAPVILLSNEWQPRSPTIGASVSRLAPDRRVAMLRSLGVPVERIASYGSDLLSTAEEAEALADLLAKRKATASTVLLVTSPYQARRAKIIFGRIMPNIRWIVVWPKKEEIPRRWWRDKHSALLVVTETAKLVHYIGGGVFRGGDVATAMLENRPDATSQRNELAF